MEEINGRQEMGKRNRCKGEPEMMAERCDVKIGIGDGLMIVDDRLMSKSTRDVCPM